MCEATQPPAGFFQGAVHTDGERELECELSFLPQRDVVEQVNQPRRKKRGPGEVVADEAITKQRDGARSRPSVDCVIHREVEVALAGVPVRSCLVQVEFSLLVAPAQLCLQ